MMTGRQGRSRFACLLAVIEVVVVGWSCANPRNYNDSTNSKAKNYESFCVFVAALPKMKIPESALRGLGHFGGVKGPFWEPLRSYFQIARGNLIS